MAERVPRPAAPCLISQVGTDGFGHQYEGKLSCIILAQISPLFALLHTKFYKFEHVLLDPVVTEKFTNVGQGILREEDLEGGPYIRRWIGGSQLLEEFTVKISSKQFQCEQNVIYEIDNCWSLVYKNLSFINEINHPSVTPNIRTRYMSTPKPNTSFFSHRRNVVVHIRRGDGIISDVDYFNRAIEYYNASLKTRHGVPPFFWIESDEPNWPPILNWTTTYPFQFIYPHADLFTTFHRMVLADGFIMSDSSLSHAACYISSASQFIMDVKDSHDRLRDLWYQSGRFLLL